MGEGGHTVMHCKMCNEDKKHMELDWQPVDSPVRFKCFSCGEYNRPETRKQQEDE